MAFIRAADYDELKAVFWTCTCDEDHKTSFYAGPVCQCGEVQEWVDVLNEGDYDYYVALAARQERMTR
jgi:hypothetical protein